MDDNFKKHLKHSSEIVASWPEWKRNILGGSKMTDDKLKRLEQVCPELWKFLTEQFIINDQDSTCRAISLKETNAIAVRILELAEENKEKDNKIREIADGFFAMEKGLEAAGEYLTAEEHEQVKSFAVLTAKLARLETAKKDVISKDLLLEFLDQRIRYYDENKFPEKSRAYNNAVINTYAWLKSLIISDKLELATNNTGSQALEQPAPEPEPDSITEEE